MNNIVLGAFGFLIIHLSDYISLKRIPLLKPIVWLLGICVLVYAVVQLCLSLDKFSMQMWLIVLGWGSFIIFLFALLYSLFVNLPFHKTYIARGFGDKLIKTGLYALVRHPGVPSFVMLILSLLLVSGSKQLFIAGPIYILLDIALVMIQDKFFFPRMFTEYHVYQQETPMLVPNRRSVNAFFKSLRQTKTQGGF
jgi:protein-S-isoprenylcysteine O-methyltransferase Ste14